LVGGPVAGEPPPSRVEPGGWGWEGVAAVALVLWAATTLGAASLLLPVKVVSDGPIYHLYFAARWWKAQRLDLIAAPFGENGATYFPAIGDLWFNALMIAWGGDRLAKIGQAPFLLVSGLTTCAIARRLGAGRASATVAAAWFVAVTPLMLFSFEANVDTLFTAGYLLAVYWFLRHAMGDDGLPALALGALAAGCALGSKATGVVFVPPLLLLGLVSAWCRGIGLRERLAGLLTVAAMPLTVAGFWYARNAMLTGNPLYPLHLEAFGRVLLRGWYGREVMPLSPYYIPVSDLGALGDTLLVVFDPRLVPLWLAALAGLWSWGRAQGGLGDAATTARPRISVDRWVWAASALAVLNIALYWLAIPYRTQQRFMFHAVGLASVPLARTFERYRAVRRLGVALLALHLLTPQAWPFSTPGHTPPQEPPWDMSRWVPNSVDCLISLPIGPERIRQASADPAVLASLVLRLAIGLGAWATAWFFARAVTARGFLAWVKAALAATVLVSGTLAAMYPWGLDSRRHFFPAFGDYYRGWLTFDLRCGPNGARVAYAGTNLPYFLMGVGLRNEVRYVNIDAHRDWLLHDYHRAAVLDGTAPRTWPNTRPGWDRIATDERAWLANLRAERIQWLVVTRANPAEGSHNLADPEEFPIERQWADAHPETFELVYGARERDPRFRLYRVLPERASGPS
jgi:hypothetical protein